MSKRKLMLVTIIGICVSLVQANWWGVGAQQQEAPPPPPAPPPNVLVERDVVIGGPGMMAEPPEIVMAPAGAEPTMAFISSEMAFDASPVKNAPYSAEAVTESTQVLGDGNRITRKTTATLYRDGAGRTRREQTLNAAGPFATAGDVPQTVFINDPVAGVNYVLEPRTRTARKLIWPPLRVGAASPVAPPHPPEAPPAPAAADAPAAPKIVEVRVRRPLAVSPVSKVDPVYPPAAKAAGAQGLVKVEIEANDAGEVVTATPLEGHMLLQPAAVAAVKQWRFKPVSVAGARPAKVKSVVSFKFVLPPAGGEAIYIEEGNVLSATPHGGAANESLGKQTIEGVEAEGTRSTFTIPEGAIGNELPIKIVNERWYSPELQTVVMTKRSDPRFGETVYRLTNINRSEPASSLFEVPADYTLKEPGGKLRMMKRIRQ